MICVTFEAKNRRAQIFRDFAQIFNKSKLSGVRLQPRTPASYTTGPRSSEGWERNNRLDSWSFTSKCSWRFSTKCSRSLTPWWRSTSWRQLYIKWRRQGRYRFYRQFVCRLRISTDNSSADYETQSPVKNDGHNSIVETSENTDPATVPLRRSTRVRKPIDRYGGRPI